MIKILLLFLIMLNVSSSDEKKINKKDINITNSIIIKVKNNNLKDINSTEKIKINKGIVIGNIGNHIGN